MNKVTIVYKKNCYGPRLKPCDTSDVIRYSLDLKLL